MHGLSVIIPAYNESGCISLALEELLKYLGRGYEYEVIVIDNGSTDSTCQIVNKYQTVRLYSINRSTVSTARNFGVKQAKFDVIYFMDADVLFTEDIANKVLSAITRIKASCKMLLGDRYDIEKNSTIIESCWFGGLYKITPKYINGGNLFISKKFFEEIGGFDESLITGEDYSLCEKATEKGGMITIDKELRVVHLGNPKTIRDFVLREIWHGTGDAVSIKSIITSKPAFISLIVGILTIISIASLLFLKIRIFLYLLLTLIVISVISAITKFTKLNLKCWIVNTILMYVYFISRFASVIKYNLGKISG
jgi:glycosyltransferase involved in cell wall biosynthesis